MSFLRDLIGTVTDTVGLTDTQAGARALAEQRRGAQRASELRKETYSPYLDMSAVANYRDFDPQAEFQASPGYQHRLGEGKRALEDSLAARGMYGSSQAIKNLNKYVQGEAAGEFDRFYNRRTGQMKDLIGFDRWGRQGIAGDIQDQLGLGREAAQYQLNKNKEVSGLMRDVASGAAGYGLQSGLMSHAAGLESGLLDKKIKLAEAKRRS